MSRKEHGGPPVSQNGAVPAGELGAPPVPVDFALRVLQRVGIPRERYDTYVRLDSPAGGLFVAFAPESVTGSALATSGLTAERFEESHRSRTGRSAIPTRKPFPRLETALRTGRVKKLPLDPGPVDEATAAVLRAVRAIPAGQLRPLSWVAREASSAFTGNTDAVLGVLARNPFVVLVPCHRVTHENGAPCDAAYLPGTGDALRAAEGIDMAGVHRWLHSGAVFLGSDTTHIYCHPTCAHARRITTPHQVPFATARDAQRAGYRACKSCRPVSV
ncbi:Ada metal-binding domain-containing protein [Streptomyces sp. NBC_00576]|uniref:Ada metal-binding domain-containing protein n=1 Tax=Streptomyces sp. NBC_00576 TaxID=2903665 RepID=UPI002E7FC8AB|nr:Ada metal-binding domain-containing protein [Streptomyces sp. NBC_00576]WUB70926.1 MGMT family protein [Streptomyces sp. NBC_00576]